MGGPKSPVQIGGGMREIKLDSIGRDIGKALNPERIAGQLGLNRFQDAADSYSDGLKSIGKSYEQARPGMAAAYDKENRAKEMGFAGETDRIAQVSKIIDAFGKVRRAKLPAALGGINKSPLSTALQQTGTAVMTKGK